MGLFDGIKKALHLQPPPEDELGAESFGFGVEREMKESGEKGGTEDINIGVGELKEGTEDTAPGEHPFIAESFGFGVEREMKESGEKGGTEDINIGVGELKEGGTDDTAQGEHFFVADSFSFGVEREMKESGEKGGTEDSDQLAQKVQSEEAPIGSSDLADWQANYGATAAIGDGSVKPAEFLPGDGETGDPVAQWNFENAWPSKVDWGGFDAGQESDDKTIIGGFKSLSGMDSETEVIESQPGSEPSLNYLPGDDMQKVMPDEGGAEAIGHQSAFFDDFVLTPSGDDVGLNFSSSAQKVQPVDGQGVEAAMGGNVEFDMKESGEKGAASAGDLADWQANYGVDSDASARPAEFLTGDNELPAGGGALPTSKPDPWPGGGAQPTGEPDPWPAGGGAQPIGEDDPWPAGGGALPTSEPDPWPGGGAQPTGEPNPWPAGGGAKPEQQDPDQLAAASSGKTDAAAVEPEAPDSDLPAPQTHSGAAQYSFSDGSIRESSTADEPGLNFTNFAQKVHPEDSDAGLGGPDTAPGEDEMLLPAVKDPELNFAPAGDVGGLAPGDAAQDIHFLPGDDKGLNFSNFAQKVQPSEGEAGDGSVMPAEFVPGEDADAAASIRNQGKLMVGVDDAVLDDDMEESSTLTPDVAEAGSGEMTLGNLASELPEVEGADMDTDSVDELL